MRQLTDGPKLRVLGLFQGETRRRPDDKKIGKTCLPVWVEKGQTTLPASKYSPLDIFPVGQL